VVHVSADSSKYSCHVHYPQIAFQDHDEQQEYMALLFSALSEVKFEIKDHGSIPILQQLVDRVPYTKFQLFRGPYACKISKGRYRPETAFRPEGFFSNNPLACFVGYVNQDYRLPLLRPAQVLECNGEVRHHQEQSRLHIHKTLAVNDWGYSHDNISLQDKSYLYDPVFEQDTKGTINLSGLSDLEKYELALQRLHPDRSCQWWSWFRISSVTYKLLQKYDTDSRSSKRIWDAYFAWSSRYPHFDKQENIRLVRANQGKERMSGLPLLIQLMKHDNPGMDINELGCWASLRSRLG